ncbi:MAG: cytochrome b/b6 domain-containing protein [Gallionella sp.]
MTQYSKRMVILHWLTLALIIAAYFLGENAHDARHDGGTTIIDYFLHIMVGVSVLALTLGRLMARKIDGVPPAAGKTAMDKVAKGIHHFLYAVLILLPFSGSMQVLTSDVGKALWAGEATMLPEKFDGVIAHEVHEIMVQVLMAIVVLHILAALWHQFILKDGLLERMSLKKKD